MKTIGQAQMDMARAALGNIGLTRTAVIEYCKSHQWYSIRDDKKVVTPALVMSEMEEDNDTDTTQPSGA